MNYPHKLISQRHHIEFKEKSVKEALIEIKILLDDNPDGNLIIEGHTSSDGEEDDNLELSKRRADAVKFSNKCEGK